jgi:hypothetical protein
MPASLNETQQTRIYRSFENFLYGISQIQVDDTTRREQIEGSRKTLQQHVSTDVSQSLHVQEAMLEYLRIREHEDALHLPQTPVPVVLVPHFQNIDHPGLQAVVKRLCLFPSSVAPSPQQQDRAAQTAREKEALRISQEAAQSTERTWKSKEHFQALLRTSKLRLLIKQLAAATGKSFAPRYHENEYTFTVYILWERGHQMDNYIEVRFDSDGTITIQGVSIPIHVWQYNKSPLEKALEQAYKHPKIHDGVLSRQ